MMQRTPLLAGNWKMNPATRAEAVTLAQSVRDGARAVAGVDVAVIPPFPWLAPVADAIAGSPLELGAQDSYWEPSGAFTGAVSVGMLAGWCRWVLAGHSERRALFGERDADVARKTAAALAVGLGVIACVGERENEHVAGQTEAVVTRQLGTVLDALEGPSADLVVAYEPVWAIGTGRNADPSHAASVLGLLRSRIADRWGAEAAEGVRLLYGGSVKGGNVGAYADLDDCDGCLVGGASLDAAEFTHMIEVVGR
jgi:triosephosphate isomerase (TIM)